jgi:hypothetical protein
MTGANKFGRMIKVVAGMVLGGVISQSARAAMIDVDFSPGSNPAQSGAAVLGSAGDIWNNITAGSGTSVALNDTTGAATSVAMTFTEAFGGNNTGGSPMDAATTNLMQDYGSFNGSTIALTGLAPSTAYTLALYGAGDQAGGDQGTTFTLPGGVIGKTTETSAGTGSRRLSDGAGVAYTLLTASSDASGNLNIAVTYNSTHFSTAPVNGFQITPAPEPASLGLLGFAGIGLIRRRCVRG